MFRACPRQMLLAAGVVLGACGGNEVATHAPLDGGMSFDASETSAGLTQLDGTVTDGRSNPGDAGEPDDAYGPCVDTTDCGPPDYPCQPGCYFQPLGGCWHAEPCLDAAWIDEHLPHP